MKSGSYENMLFLRYLKNSYKLSREQSPGFLLVYLIARTTPNFMKL
jgi:hypothetical protein